LASSQVGLAFKVQIVLCDPTLRLEREVKRSVRGAEVSTFRANLGFAEACNWGAGRASGEFVVLLNDDIIVTADWLDHLVDTARRRQKAGLIFGTLLNPDGTLQEAGSVLGPDGSPCTVGEGEEIGYMMFERRVQYASAGLVLIRREAWEDLGGIDTGFYPAYYEDVDLCLRAAEVGWESWYQPRAIAVHHRSSSTGASFREFLFDRSRRRLLERWANRIREQPPTHPIEQSVWFGMGRPLRVLVIDEAPAASNCAEPRHLVEVLTRLSAESDLYVCFHPLDQRPFDYGAITTINGLRSVNDLAQHLDTEGVDFDVVVFFTPSVVDACRTLIVEKLPHARVIHDAAPLTFLQLQIAIRHPRVPRNRWPEKEADQVVAKAGEPGAAFQSGVRR
jgi:hypothetical protein